MTFKQLQKESYSFQLYENIKSGLLIHNETPLKVIRIDNKITSKVLIIKKSRTGTISTRQVNLPREDTLFFTSWIAEDFPNINIELIEGDI